MHDVRRIGMSVLIILVSAWIGISVLMYLFQERYIFYPVAELDVTPAAAGIPFDDVWIDTEDGVALHGWWIPADNPRWNMVFCHGNAGNISHRIDSLIVFRKLGISVLIFDYRGYGKSGGSISEEGLYRDAGAVYRHLTERLKCSPESILIFGRSLGSAVAVELASHVPCRALIIESPFTSMIDLGSTFYPYLPVRLLGRYRFDTLKRIGVIRVPTLVLHATADEIVPFEMGRRVYEASGSELKRFVTLSGGHNDGFLVTGKAYRDAWTDFLKTL